jgi:chromate reductase, NAD(P)H dehydrogenase (quinone)
MSSRKKVLAISGSTRQNSSNHKLINAITALAADQMEITLFESISALPHFNPDDNEEQAGKVVEDFRQQLRNADGVLICTPEYAHGVPGSLKNAIDWTVSTSEFYHKPTALITASTDGRFGHAALLETLKVIVAENIDQLQMVIPFIKTKVNEDSCITDEKTLQEVTQLIEHLIGTMNEKEKTNSAIS